MSSLASLPAARRLRLPLVNASLRGGPAVPSLRERLACWCARRSDAIVTNGGAQLEAVGLAADRRARVISNGLDLARFDRVVPAGADGPAVCMVANFSRFKDHVTLIRALPHIRERVPQAALTLVGRDAGTLDGARRLVAELAVDGAVRFVTDTFRPEPIIAASAVGVLSTHGEGLSNAILEYMALAKPVVATDCPGNAEVVRDAETGYLVAPGSPESLAARIIELLSDRERARAMGARGRRLVESHYSLDRMVADYERLYDELGAGR